MASDETRAKYDDILRRIVELVDDEEEDYNVIILLSGEDGRNAVAAYGYPEEADVMATMLMALQSMMKAVGHELVLTQVGRG